MRTAIRDFVQEHFPDFAEETQSLNVEQLKERLVNLQKGLEESEIQKEVDEELQETRAKAKELGAPYRDIKKAVTVKTKYILELLKEKGQ